MANFVEIFNEYVAQNDGRGTDACSFSAAIPMPVMPPSDRLAALREIQVAQAGRRIPELTSQSANDMALDTLEGVQARGSQRTGAARTLDFSVEWRIIRV